LLFERELGGEAAERNTAQNENPSGKRNASTLEKTP